MVGRLPTHPEPHALGLAPARNALDFGLDDPLNQSRQIVVEPGFQHRPQHFLDQVFQRPRIVAEHGIGQRVEGAGSLWIGGGS